MKEIQKKDSAQVSGGVVPPEGDPNGPLVNNPRFPITEYPQCPSGPLLPDPLFTDPLE